MESKRILKSVGVSVRYVYLLRSKSIIVFSIADPRNLQELGNCAISGLHHIYIPGGCSYTGGFSVKSIADTENLGEVTLSEISRVEKDVAISGDYVYVTDSESELRVIFFSGHYLPNEVGFFDTEGDAKCVSDSSDYACVADLRDLRGISVRNPRHPEEVGYYDNPGDAYWIALVTGGLIFVADYANTGISVLQISLSEMNPRLSFWGSSVGASPTPIPSTQ